MDEDFEAHLVVVVVECQKRDSQTDSTIIYIDETSCDIVQWKLVVAYLQSKCQY